MWYALTVAFFLTLQGLPPLLGPLIPDSGGRVTGILRRTDTRQPIPSGQVAVAVVGTSLEAAMTRAVVTDRDGRFIVKGLEPGLYTVMAQAEGYFSPSHDPTSATHARRDVSVFEGQESDIGVIELVPAAAISGRISSSDGSPVIGASVQAWRALYVRGQLVFTVAKTAETNDRGEYRLFWLAAGEYYVASQYRVVGGSARYRRAFFPGILEEDAAPPVAVGAAREISGIDIQVPIMPIAGVTVSGQIAGEPDKLAALRVTSIQLVPRDRRVLLADDRDNTFPNRAVPGGGGRFEITNVPPGEFDLIPMVGDSDSPVRLGRINVSVADRNIENLSVALDSQTELKGRVTLDGMPADNLKPGSILLMSLDTFEEKRNSKPLAPDPRTGEFVIPGVAAGRYGFQMSAAARASGLYIADVLRSEASVFNAGFLAGDESPGDLHIQLKSAGGVVSGTVLDVSRIRPFPYAMVALLPERARRGNYTLHLDTISGADGKFMFTGVPPGNYVLLAWQAVIPGAWQNPLFLARFEDRAVSIVVEGGAEKNTQVVVIP
jgi:hypothetical protein